jgi:hypothetical protein
MYLQSRSRRWLVVLHRSQTVLHQARATIKTYADAAKQRPTEKIRVINERDQQVMTLMARDPIILSFEGQRLEPDSWLGRNLDGVGHAIANLEFGEAFSDGLEELISATDTAITQLEERTVDAEPAIDEIVDELERALLLSLVVTLTSHNVLLEKVSDWENSHSRFLQGHLENDVGHYFDVKTLNYADTSGPGRIHMQDLVVAIDAGATIWMAGAGRQEVDNYPEVQAVAYAQWFAYAFALWEEQFRGRVAQYFDQQSDERIRRSDVLVDFFGDIRLIRNDFVHNKGICKESAGLKVLHWELTQGVAIEISAQQMMSLIDLFPRSELRQAPTPQSPGETLRVPGKVDPRLLEDVQERGRALGLTEHQILTNALSSWLQSTGDGVLQ